MAFIVIGIKKKSFKKAVFYSKIIIHLHKLREDFF